jgi:hypothetical protein
MSLQRLEPEDGRGVLRLGQGAKTKTADRCDEKPGPGTTPARRLGRMDEVRRPSRDVASRSRDQTCPERSSRRRCTDDPLLARSVLISNQFTMSSIGTF